MRAASRRLISLLLTIGALAGLIAWASATGRNASFAPQLALDLQGGTSIILQPTLASGEAIKEGTLEQAVAIIRQRVDGTGVAEAQITTQGTGSAAVIVVAIPGKPDENTLKLIKASALLQFRPVLATSAASNTAVGGNTSTASPNAPSSAPIATSSAKPTDASDLNWVDKEILAQYDALSCRTTATSIVADFREPGQVDDPTKPLVTCDRDGYTKFILGPVELAGTDIADANAATRTTQTGAMTNDWAVQLKFNSAGSKEFGDITKRLFPLQQPYNQFAVTLDGYVITAPSTNAVILGGEAEITGNFTREESKSLADQLKYGSLPIGFEVQSQENISATLGTAQLVNGLIAGAIGLFLVIIYSLFQYRGLALITIGSLIVAGVITYLVICFLSWRQGFRLSLSGVAGLIVSIGITADSFIVYFERVRDEIREGKPVPAAVEMGWRRAWRTILVSGGVNLLAAVVLFLLTVGNVRGFAYTLGLTTVIDIFVAALFTYPILQILSTRKFFASGGKWSGFDIKSMTASGYVGRGQFRQAKSVSEAKSKKVNREVVRRQTIAERKAAANNQGEGEGKN